MEGRPPRPARPSGCSSASRPTQVSACRPPPCAAAPPRPRTVSTAATRSRLPRQAPRCGAGTRGLSRSTTSSRQPRRTRCCPARPLHAGHTRAAPCPPLRPVHPLASPPLPSQVLRVGGQLGTGWARSLAGDGVQTARTSSTSWCKVGCSQAALPRPPPPHPSGPFRRLARARRPSRARGPSPGPVPRGPHRDRGAGTGGAAHWSPR